MTNHRFKINSFFITEDPPFQSGLYIHVPFCRSKCRYCDFYSIVASDDHVAERYIESLSKEMAFYSDYPCSFDTIYIGGGTPSILTVEQLCQIFGGIGTYFKATPNCEFTIEVNPGSVTENYTAYLFESPVNRVNIGIQSFDDRVLAFLGRRHRAREAFDVFDAFRRIGFTNIGIDLIYGIPGQDRKNWEITLKSALQLLPEHLSCYQLTLEPTTPLGRDSAAGKIRLPDEVTGYDFFMTTAEILQQGGYIQYEVSNFARGDHYISKHNSKYWTHQPYLGLGPAAHSFSKRRRWWNYPSLDRYCHCIDTAVPPIMGVEDLSTEQLGLEALFLGMRTRRGINLDVFADRYSYDLLTAKGNVIAAAIEEGLLVLENRWLQPTLRGMALADYLCTIL